MKRTLKSEKSECVPLEVFLFEEQDELPELALILLHQSVSTNLKEKRDKQQH